MKIHPTIYIITSITHALSHGAIIVAEDFEDGLINYTTSITEFSDGSSDYFGRVPTISITGVSFNNTQGNGYFAAQDIDGEGADSQQSLTFSNINISNYTDLEFSAFWAEDDDGSNQSWDISDFVLIEYNIDDGGFQNLFAIEDQGATNTEPRIDTDFNGIGDGAVITDTFTQYTSPIAQTGDLITIRITFDLNSGDEDIAFDNIQLTGTLAAVPEPSAYPIIIGFSLLSTIAFRRFHCHE